MIFFLDENFPKAGGDILRKEGHIVYDIRGTQNEGMNDKDIFQLAQDKKAIFLTTDRDFFHTIPLLHPEHHGIIICNLRQPNRFNISEKITWTIRNIDLTDFRSRILMLRDTTYILTGK